MFDDSYDEKYCYRGSIAEGDGFLQLKAPIEDTKVPGVPSPYSFIEERKRVMEVEFSFGIL